MLRIELDQNFPKLPLLFLNSLLEYLCDAAEIIPKDSVLVTTGTLIGDLDAIFLIFY